MADEVKSETQDLARLRKIGGRVKENIAAAEGTMLKREAAGEATVADTNYLDEITGRVPPEHDVTPKPKAKDLKKAFQDWVDIGMPE